MSLFKRLFPGAAKPSSRPVAIPVHPRIGKFVSIPKGESPKVGGKPISIPGTGKPVAVPAGRPVATPARPKALRQAQVLGRAEPPTGARTTIPVQHTQAGEDQFLHGTDTFVTSSWLKLAVYDRDGEVLSITFLDGFTAHYQAVSEAVARAFFRAPSKGAFTHDVLLGPGYVYGQPGTAAYRWT